MRVIVAAVVALALSFTSLPPANASVPTVPSEPSGAIQAHDVERSLRTAGFHRVDVALSNESAHTTARNPWAGLNLNVDMHGSIGTVVATDDDGRSSRFALNVDTMTPELITFTLTHPSTGETFAFNSREHATPSRTASAAASAPLVVSAQPRLAVPVAIPIVFVGISLGTVLYYLAIGAAIIVAGYYALEATRAIAAAWKNSARKRRQKPHLKAFRQGNQVFLAQSMTEGQAMRWARRGKDTWSYTSGWAKSLCRKVGSGAPVWDPPHGTGYMYHYHPYKRRPNMHCFYGWPS